MEQPIDFFNDLRLKRKIPVWWKYRKLHKIFGSWNLGDIEYMRIYFFMYKDEQLLKTTLIKYEEYFDNTLEYLKVLKPNKSIEDNERYKLLSQDFFATHKEITDSFDEIIEKMKKEAELEFQKEIHLLKNKGDIEKMYTINKLIDEESWVLLSFRERYGNGVWVAIGPVINHLYELQQIKDGGDIQSLDLGDYLENVGSWLPTAFALDYYSAVDALEEKIKTFAHIDSWRSAVGDAFLCIYESDDGSYGLRRAVEAKNPALLPPKIENGNLIEQDN